MSTLSLNLSNALEMSIKHPTTFGMPTFDEIANLKKNDFVKVCYQEEGCGGERFWCKVTSVRDNIIYANVDNMLVNYDIPLGTKLKIKFTNVYDIMHA